MMDLDGFFKAIYLIINLKEKVMKRLILGLSIMLISTISTAEKNYTPMSLLGAQIAYDDSTQPRIKLLEEEKDGNGFAALMLSRCYKIDFADCKKDRALAEQYEKTLPLIQSKL